MDEIDRKISEFKTQTGKRPTNIYLEEQQWYTLMKWANEFYGYSHDIEGKDVPECGGCKIYRIYAENHIAVA